jgi:major intracellular serine protease
VKINYNSLLNLPAEIKSNNGEGVVVAVLDSGCQTNHKDLNQGILAGFDTFTGTSEIIDESDTGHGTFICGIIAGNTATDGVTGIAPKTKIIPVRVIQNVSVSSENVLKGLQWLLNECPVSPHIINMSFDFSPGPDRQEIEILLQQAADRKILLVAAGQDYTTPLKSGVYYPSMLPPSIAIAVLDSSIVNDPRFNSVNDKIEFILPKYMYNSTGNDVFSPYTEDEGSSFATAVISGVLSLVSAYKKQQQIEMLATDILNNNLPEFNKELFTNSFKIWKK